MMIKFPNLQKRDCNGQNFPTFNCFFFHSAAISRPAWISLSTSPAALGMLVPGP